MRWPYEIWTEHSGRERLEAVSEKAARMAGKLHEPFEQRIHGNPVPGGKKTSDIFWELDGRIKHDKKLTGVVVHDMSRSNMYGHLIDLLMEKAITLDDLSDFSDDLQERLRGLVMPEESNKRYFCRERVVFSKFTGRGKLQ